METKYSLITVIYGLLKGSIVFIIISCFLFVMDGVIFHHAYLHKIGTDPEPNYVLPPDYKLVTNGKTWMVQYFKYGPATHGEERQFMWSNNYGMTNDMYESIAHGDEFLDSATAKGAVKKFLTKNYTSKDFK